MSLGYSSHNVIFRKAIMLTMLLYLFNANVCFILNSSSRIQQCYLEEVVSRAVTNQKKNSDPDPNPNDVSCRISDPDPIILFYI